MQYDLTDADYLVIDEIADEVRSDYQDQDDPPTADRTSRAKPKRRNPPDRSSATSEPDDELWDRQRVLEYFGGSKPIHTSTLYRGVNSGIYPPPMNVSPNAVRWIGQEC